MNIAALVGEVLGEQPLRIRPTNSPVAFFVDLPGRTVIAKLPAPGRPGSALVEAWAYRAVADRGVKVPAVLGVGTDPECIVIATLPGYSLWSPERPPGHDLAAWRRSGEDLRAMHEIQLPGFGPVCRPDGPRGEAGEWCPFVRYAPETGIGRLVDAGYMSPDVARRLEGRYDEVADSIRGYTDGRLLHGDLEGGHIYITDAGYQGLIDFGQAQVGDPRWDLARITLWDGDSALDALLDGYGADAVSRDDRELLLPLYLFAFVVHHAARMINAGTTDGIGEHLDRSNYHLLL